MTRTSLFLLVGGIEAVGLQRLGKFLFVPKSIPSYEPNVGVGEATEPEAKNEGLAGRK